MLNLFYGTGAAESYTAVIRQPLGIVYTPGEFIDVGGLQRFRLVNDPQADLGPRFSFLGLLAYQRLENSQPGGNILKWFSTGIRPAYHFNQYFSLVAEIGFSNKDFIAELLSSEQIMLYDDYGIRRTINTREIWGYVENGRLYIMLGGHFQRIIIQGSISLFSASATTREKTKFVPLDTSTHYTSTNDLYRSFYGKDYYYKNITGERREYLFDFESNTLTAFNHEDLGMLIERDPVLSSEYESLKTREKKRRMLEFIRRYNENHPLFFPDN